MRQAYGWAAHAVGISDPNPPVGALIVDKNARIIGKGFTQQAGSYHAEVMAIREALKNSNRESLREATLYVTLEPCSHQGRTPPCVDAIVGSEIRTVVIDQVDPSKRSSGRGIRELKEQGISVHLLEAGSLETERFFTLFPFFKRTSENLPMIVLKWAQTREGFLSPEKGESGRISSDDALEMVYRMRHLSRACLATSGTVYADQPRLNARMSNFLKEENIQYDRSFFSTLLKRYDSISDHNVSNYRYFMLPRKWGEKQIIDFHKKQAAIDEHFLFSVSNTGQEAIFRKHRLPFIVADMRGVLKRIGSDGNNQVLIEAGPSMAEWLIGSGLVDTLVCVRSKDRTWPHGTGFSMSKILAVNTTKKTLQGGFRLIANIGLEKDNILCLIKKSGANKKFFEDGF